MKKVVAEYFAGIGLVRMGLESQGWEVVFANDISPKKHEMYQGFFPSMNAHYVVEDIFNLEPLHIPTATLATCSFPCVDLSLAGNMSGIRGKHSSAFWGFARILKEQGEAAPPLIMVENVPGWIHSNKGADFRLTVQALNDLGYYCDVFTLDALRFTPQSRLRVFLIGIKDRYIASDLGAMLSRPKALLPDMLRQSLLANSDLKWFYNQIPEPPPLRTKGLSEIVEKISDNDPLWWSKEEVDRHLKMMDVLHYDRIIALKDKLQVSYRAFYRRRREAGQRSEVRNDDLSGCLRTAIGGSGKQFLIQVGLGQIKMRVMTPREYARLQGVPDHFSIHAKGVQALTGFGDAVCVPAIAWITQNVLNPLTEKYISEDVAFLKLYDR